MALSDRGSRLRVLVERDDAQSDQAVQLVDSLPVAAKKVRDNLRAQAGVPSRLDTMQKAAAQIEQAAAENSAAVLPRTTCR